MKLIIEVNIVSDVPEAAQPEFGKRVVEHLRENLNGNTIIEEALKAGALHGTTAEVGRRNITVENDSPVIYGVRE